MTGVDLNSKGHARGAWGRGGHPFAALDLGTNNCRLLIAVPADGGFRVVDSFSRIVRLGEGLQATGRLGEAAIGRAIEALRGCSARLERRPPRGMRAVATEACRQAANGPAFLARVREETGLVFETITAREEATLAIESCAPLMQPTARRALLFDIGGGSTELAWVRLDGGGAAPELIGTESLPLGVVTLSERFGPAAWTQAGFAAMVEETRDRLLAFERVHCIGQEIRRGGVQMLGTSGTVTTLSGVALNLVRYRRPLVDGSVLTAAAAVAIDGGYTDNAPLEVQDAAAKSKTLVLLTRHYPKLPALFGWRGRSYLQPSARVPVSTWQCLPHTPVRDAFALGLRDAAALFSRGALGLA